jgi:diguanylate cyclase (GGDEF)-like protein/PAS domain S-box-containing protein
MILDVPDLSKVYTKSEDRVRLIKLLESSNRVEGFEAEGICKDGKLIWCSINVNAVRGPDGEILRLDSRLMDITERKLAEVAIQQKTEDLDRFFNLSLDLLCIADTEGYFRRLNRAWEDTLGFSLDDLIGRSFLNLVHPEDLDKTLSAMSDLSNQQPVINFVNRYRCKDGTYKWIEWRSIPVGNLIYAAARDITEHKLSEEELYESRRMLQLVLDNIPQRVFWKDINLKFLGCNRWLAMDAGINKTTDIIGKSDFDLNWKDRAALYRSDDQWVMDNDSPKLNFEEPLPLQDGSQNWVLTNKVPLHDRDGKVIGVLGTYEDITNRKKDEEQVRLTNEKLTGMVSTLEKRNHEANLLREMDDLLQICNTPEEAYSVIQQYCGRLFPTSSGALFLFNKSRRMVEANAIWGENLQSELVFSSDDCWTLRRVQVHQWNSLTSNLRCKHIPSSFKGEYLGIPMSAAGELMGMLHIENQEPGWQKKDIEELVLILSEHLALSLSNINLREKLRAQSIRDPLTGLFNRRYMEETLEREILRANRAKTAIGIIMLDIDHFKDFNDTFGHEAGDAILHALGLLLQCQVRSSDVACRFGGEEFILILPEASVEITRERAEQIRLAVREMHIEFAHQAVGDITVSLGIAGYSIHGKTSEELMQKVDKALYKAKRLGRDRVEMADN